MISYELCGWNQVAASRDAHYFLRTVSQEWDMVEPPEVITVDAGWLRQLARRGERGAEQALAAIEAGTHALRGLAVTVGRSRQDGHRVHTGTDTRVFLWVEKRR